MTRSPFDGLKQAADLGDATALLSQLVTTLRSEAQYHELFEALKMQVRHRVGLPVLAEHSGEDMADPTRDELEDGLIDACREVGILLLRAGRIREAWMYLRPVGDNALVARELSAVEANDDNTEELIEVLLTEGVDTRRGFALLLEQYGTCNAITTLESQWHAMDRRARQAATELLLRRVHGELVENVRAHIAQHESAPPEESRLDALLESRLWLTEDDNYHLDTSHLASTVRLSKTVEDGDLLQLAWELTQYGIRLSKTLQYPGEEPFVDLYASHSLFFGALLGRDTDEAIRYFRQRAREADMAEHGTAAVETYVDFLARLGRVSEAIEARILMIPADQRTAGLAPSLFELCRKADDFGPLLEQSRRHNDILAYATGLLQQKK